MPQQNQNCKERIIFFHKHGTSARTRFLRFAADTVCAFEPLPELASHVEGSDECDKPNITTHPAVLLKQAAERLQIAPETLELEPEYCEWVDVPEGPVQVALVRFTSIDPPFELSERLEARFIDLTQARDLPDVELLLLRRAYEVILGG